MNTNTPTTASTQTVPPITVIAQAGYLDSDLVPHFLEHYRGLGVTGFRFVLHGDFDPRSREFLYAQSDVEIFAETYGLFSERSKVEKIDVMLHGLEGQWALTCDLDEFIELPTDSLAQTITAMEQMGMTCLPAFMVQRLAENGALPELTLDADIQQLFPLYSFNLAERTELEYPTNKTKFPFFKVIEGYKAEYGFHFPPVKGISTQKPLRATLSHFKWRDRLKKAAQSFRAKDTNISEMETYHDYIEASEDLLPLEGARTYIRSDLIKRGLLVTPPNNIKTPLAPKDKKLRICLVAREFTGQDKSGGAGTATTAMAENLVARGHNVEILLIPYHLEFALWPFWIIGWQAFGIKIHQILRDDGSGYEYTLDQLTEKTLEYLEEEQFDIALCDDASSLCMKALQIRASGLGLANTAIGMTTHGCTRWHAYGGTMPNSQELNKNHFAFEQQTRLADLVIHPSQYMSDWVHEHVDKPSCDIVIPNALMGFSRSFSCGRPEPRMPDEIVFFGRIEPRKGFDLFLDAIEELKSRGATIPKVTLLGFIGRPAFESVIKTALKDVAVAVKLISNFSSLEAVNYLKAHDCFVVIPSRQDNLPYTVYECLENGIPMICSDVGGINELVHPDDWERSAVATNPTLIADAIELALRDGWLPAQLAFDVDEASEQQIKTLEAMPQKFCREEKTSMKTLSMLALHFTNYETETPQDQLQLLKKIIPNNDHIVSNLGVAERDFRKTVAVMNETIMQSQQDYVLLCHETARILDARLPAAMAKMLDDNSFDAVVCDYYPRHVSREGQLLGIGAKIEAPGGPPEIAPSWNVFGAGICLVRRTSIIKAGLIDKDCVRSDTVVWELLNKICANGGSITAIPRTLVCKTISDGDAADLDTRQDEYLHWRLSRHWLHDLDNRRAAIISATIYEQSKRCPFTHSLLVALNLAPLTEDTTT
ncbi:MAG: glycosyltransferase [Hyphomicrobiales bacterium]